MSHLEGDSGHADSDGLMKWLGGFTHAARQAFVVQASLPRGRLRTRIADELGWVARVPEQGFVALVGLKPPLHQRGEMAGAIASIAGLTRPLARAPNSRHHALPGGV